MLFNDLGCCYFGCFKAKYGESSKETFCAKWENEIEEGKWVFLFFLIKNFNLCKNDTVWLLNCGQNDVILASDTIV